MEKFNKLQNDKKCITKKNSNNNRKQVRLTTHWQVQFYLKKVTIVFKDNYCTPIKTDLKVTKTIYRNIKNY